MSPDKVLHKIQVQIKDIASTLELFIEETIQPTSTECENLQSQLTKLQENLTIYRYLRENKELSPSFNIHAKISEVQAPVEKAPEPKVEAKPRPVPEPPLRETPPVKTELKEAIVESISSEPVKQVKSI